MSSLKTSTFLHNETGAVTVDWVVLTAALVGLGLAVMTLVSSGAETQSNNITDGMRGVDIVTAFDVVFDENDFSNGRGNWVGGQVLDIPSFGEVLALSGNSNVASLPITLYPGMRVGQVSFMQMTTAADNPYGSGIIGSKYQGQVGPRPSQYWKNFTK